MAAEQNKLTHKVLKPGHKFHYDGYLYHVVLPFEDNGEQLYVMKYYGKHKQWWHYEIWSAAEYDIVVEKVLGENIWD